MAKIEDVIALRVPQNRDEIVVEMLLVRSVDEFSALRTSVFQYGGFTPALFCPRLVFISVIFWCVILRDLSRRVGRFFSFGNFTLAPVLAALSGCAPFS